MPSKAYPWLAGSPIAQNGEMMQEIPDPKPALARYGASTQASSVITLTDDTTMIDIAVVGPQGTGLAVKWIPTTDTQASVVASGATANFDYAIPSPWRQRLAVPVEKTGASGSSSMVGVNLSKGLYKRFAYIGTGAPMPSVFVAEH